EIADLGTDSLRRIVVYDRFIVCVKDERFGCVDYSGRTVVPFLYDALAYDEQYSEFIFWENGLTGLMDSTGKKLTEARFDFIRPFCGNFAEVNDNSNNKRNTNNLLSREGDLLFPPGQYDSLYMIWHNYPGWDPGRDGYLVVNPRHGHGVVSGSGKLIVPDTFLAVCASGDGYAAYTRFYWFLFDSAGRQVGNERVKPPVIGWREMERPVYKIGNVFADSKGQVLITGDYDGTLDEYDYIYPFYYDNYIRYRRPSSGDSEVFMIRHKDKLIDVYTMSGKKLDGISGRAAYLTRFDRRMDNFIFGDAGAYYGKDQRLYGLMDSTGRVILPKVYRRISTDVTDSTRLIAIDSTGSMLYFDFHGNPVDPPLYSQVYYPELKSGLLLRAVNGKYGLTDKSGKVIVPFVYDELVELDPGYFCYKRDGKFGLLRADGTVITPPRYSAPLQATTHSRLFFIYNEGFIDIYGREYWKN
ncbi:MAG TPA: WG repeat-containing protein, partial [Bacteroidia bacterium]|nr:WG repeat-containing protein [Bacteroidia bacterium]